GADHHHAQVLAIAARLGDEGLEQVEAGVHRAGREQHLGHVVLVAPELLADHVHARYEPAEDQVARVHVEVQAFLGLAGHRVLVAQDQRPRHDRVVERLLAHVGAPAPLPGTVAYPALRQAVMPPLTLYQSVRPRWASALITVLERRPPAHTTALGRP